MPIVTVWECAEHGEFESLGEIPEAHCVICGKEMKRTGKYEE